MSEEPPRLYSAPPKRQPVDVIAPQHVELHAELERWGAWNRERGEQGKCSSVESGYSSGGREPGRAIIALPPDPRLSELDRIVRFMRLQVPDHGQTVKLFYADRKAPLWICYTFNLRFEGFPAWMFACRAMVINIGKQGVSWPHHKA